ncbi:phage portal protein [Viridibacillus arvi]|uniref:phage portal protein n=1 Tax=Viridibacillus arvi TaxID=263475 RepID=UPI0034CDF8DB
MSILKKAFAAAFPERALNRSVAKKKLDIMNSGYSNYGASKSKKSMLGWKAKGGSTKEDIDGNVSTLRERSRDAYMGIPIATGALKRMRTNAIGAGLRLNATIDYEFLGMTEEEASTWETTVEREFSLWAESLLCDSMQMNNFYDLQQIAFLSQLMSGEVFVLMPYLQNNKDMPYGTRIQLIEADRISSPNNKDSESIINGVEVGKNGEVSAYHISQFHPLSKSQSEKKWMKVEKWGKKTERLNILHLMEAERPEQRRGVPILSPVLESLKQLGRYSDAELMAAVVSSMFTVFVKSETGEDNPLESSYGEDDQVDEDDPNSYELGTGSIIGLAEGESVEVANPGRNNTSFDPFVTSICRQIGSAIEMPYELLLMHFTSSYSASRAALLEAWKRFRMQRTFMAIRFCQPIYEEWLTEAILLGRIDAPGFFDDPMIRKAYAGAEWNGPAQGQLDPLKEVNAAIKRVDNEFSTRAKETAELNGGDFWVNMPQRIAEEKARKEGGLDLVHNELLMQEGVGKDEDSH